MKTATILLTFFVIGCSAPASAASILNLSGKPQRFEIEVAGGYQPFVIPAGRRWEVTASARVKYQGHVSYIEDDQEYAVWQDGTFGPQRRFPRRGGGGL